MPTCSPLHTHSARHRPRRPKPNVSVWGAWYCLMPTCSLLYIRTALDADGASQNQTSPKCETLGIASCRRVLSSTHSARHRPRRPKPNVSECETAVLPHADVFSPLHTHSARHRPRRPKPNVSEV
ncbi:hypothetical protein EVAR_18926_1 [Eumeta japonica]|uniref:Uncharacterized protein n=1 Tax=Eumeta variegata TaxID=151549 RepID=A0A4C1V1V5_EUMVA|nr:hypothetical protein EVAR_18926_1 [Eumeta japonica]